MPVEMIPVRSSTIAAVGYDLEARELHVQFHKTGLYVYDDVPEKTFHELLAAPSAGSHLHEFVKSAHRHRKG